MGYKAKFSPRFFRSKCKPSPLPCLSWDGVGGVGQGWFRILHKSGIEFPGAGRSPGLAVWPGMLGRLAAWVERLGGGLIGCRWWAALLCCDFLCAPSLFSPLPLSPSPDRRLPGCRRWGWLWCLAGRWLCMGAGVPGSLGWVGLALPCWPCVLSASAGCWLCLSSSGGWLSPGSCWPLLGVDYLGGAAGCWLWLRLGFPGSWLRLGAGLAGVQAVPVVVAGLGDGQAVGVVAGVSRSSNCTDQALQVWLLFKGKAINFERFFLDFAHKVRYNSTRVKEIVNQLRFAASPLVDGGRNPQKGLVKQS